MTITTSTNTATFLGNGAQTVFDFDFVWGSQSYLTAIYVSPAGISTVLPASAYSLSLTPAIPGQIWGVGGSITYPLSGSPIPVGGTLTIQRVVPELQTVSLTNQGSQTPQSMEQGLDLLEMQIQQVGSVSSYAFTAPTTDPTPPLPTPPAAQRANQGAVFDANGNLTAGVLPSTGVISSAMQPVVSAATVALGRTAFGLGALATDGFGAGLASDGAGNARVTQVVVEDSTSQTVDATFAWNLRVATQSIVYTLPPGGTLWNGFTFNIDALQGPVTLAIPGSDTFIGQSSGSSLVIPWGEYSVTITTDGAVNATWYVKIMPLYIGGLWLPGDLKMSASNGVPSGWFQNNGQAVSRTTFSNLFSVIGTLYGTGDGSTTFNVPNDLGCFWRPWNNTGSGPDAGRAFGSVQQHQLQQHTHAYTTFASSTTSVTGGSGSVNQGNQGPQSTGVNGANQGSETRPTNIAFLSLIKY